MNIDLQPTTNRLSAQLGSKITWGRKLTVAASYVAESAIERKVLKAQVTLPEIIKKEMVWELVPGSPPLQRLLLRSRQGHCWSYPYGYLGLISMLSPKCLRLHCTSAEVEAILVHGIKLDSILVALCEHRVVMLCESDNPLIAKDGVIIREIQVLAGKAKQEKPHAE